MENLRASYDGVVAKNHAIAFHGITENGELTFSHLLAGMLCGLGIAPVGVAVVKKHLLVLDPRLLVVSEGMANAGHGHRRDDIGYDIRLVHVPLGKAFAHVVPGFLDIQAVDDWTKKVTDLFSIQIVSEKSKFSRQLIDA
jgi:hypothetical protein